VTRIDPELLVIDLGWKLSTGRGRQFALLK